MTIPNVYTTSKKHKRDINPYKESTSTLSPRVILLVVSAVILVSLLWAGNSGDKYINLGMRGKSSSFSDVGVTANDLGEMVVPRLVPETLLVGSYKVFYMLPSSGQKVKGILLHFHACGHRGADFFILPEDRIIAYEALQRGLAVVSMNALDENTGCWNAIDGNDIIQRNRDDAKVMEEEDTIAKWKQLVGVLDDIPVMVLGASNFVFYAWNNKKIKVQAVASYIMGYGGRLGGFFEGDVNRKRDDPELPLPNAVIFVYMDESDNRSDLGFYNGWLNDYVHINSQLLDVKPHTFTASSCARTIPELGYQKCTQLISFLHKNYPHLLSRHQTSSDDENHNNNSHYIPKFRHEDWHVALLETGLLSDSLKMNKRMGRNFPAVSFQGHPWLYESVVEELNTVLGMNEMIAAGKDQVLDFLMCHSKIGPCP